ncbi:MAG TPA: GNAT family N-acetyltransferase [Clostridia bacterium]|nr:GNAT family N-acetyltransferase [Clostridia bacterium]
MNIIIRKAQKSDSKGVLRLLEQIAELHHQGRPDIFKGHTKKYSEDELSEILKEAGKPVFVAVDEDNNVLGYVFCMIAHYKDHAVFNDYRSLYIDDFCVDERARGQNIGKKLFDAVKIYAKEVGVYNIDLNVWAFNEGAIRFYEKCGFVTQRRTMEMVL